jgi:glycosyltransferase involved in cell wall biosynthesis
MRIALLSSLPVPRIFGGQDRLIEGLSNALRERHPTDLITIPVDERSVEGVMRGYWDFYNLDLSAYDLVISYKAPSYMVRHPVHVLYLSHRLRVFYDLYQPRDQQHARLRRMVHWMDNWAMSSARLPFIFTVGQAVSKRLRIWGGIPSTPIHHPTTFKPDAAKPGEHFFAVGRLHPWKRFDLIINAMRASKCEVPLLIAGTGDDEARLRDLAAGDTRIRFLGQIDEAGLRDCYARSIATIFPPINEDLGMVTFESFLSGKPVLTTIDAGEPADIVKPGKTGFITQATPEAMAERLDWMATHRSECSAMAEHCRSHMREITWARLVNALLDAAEKIQGIRGKKAASTPEYTPPPPLPEVGHGGVISTSAKRKIHLLVTDNQLIDPPVGGGRLRIWELYRHLPSDFTTTYIGTHDHPGPVARDQWLAPNFREIIMPLTAVHFKMHEVWRRLTGGDATIDVTIPLLLGRFSPRYPRLIAEHLPNADLLIYAHPWVFPWLPENPLQPRIYDSQNCEAALKYELLKRTVAGRRLAHRVEDTERAAIAAARLTFACSEADRDEFSSRYGTPEDEILIVPNGVDCSRYNPVGADEKRDLRRRLSLPDRPLAIFIGSQYGPNMDATDYLIREVAPAVPQLTIGIIGGAGAAWQEQHPGEPLPENIHVFGTLTVEQMQSVMAAAEFGLNPMTTGSGTNIKMLDYMAAGLAIHTTATGARGLEGQAGTHWSQAETPQYIAVLRDLLNSPTQYTALAERARRLAELRYDWALISTRMADHLRQLLIPRPPDDQTLPPLPAEAGAR